MNQGDVISYLEMCQKEGCNLQRGMNFKLNNGLSVILMSLRENAPYADRIEDNGKTLIYEGHDIPNYKDLKISPKNMDQPKYTPTGKFTENGKFYNAAMRFKKGEDKAEKVKVYEKIKNGIWVYNGIFELVDSWNEKSNDRSVFKFKLKLIDDISENYKQETEIDHNRLIPSSVKIEVWKRDKGQCVICGSNKNLHFDHVLPFSKGGASLVSENIQLLCVKHNLQKSNKIQ